MVSGTIIREESWVAPLFLQQSIMLVLSFCCWMNGVASGLVLLLDMLDHLDVIVNLKLDNRGRVCPIIARVGSEGHEEVGVPMHRDC